MIVFDLRCRRDHEFEAWFASSEAFEKQARAKKVACPVCGDTRVAKALMAPAVSGTKTRDAAAPPPHKSKGAGKAVMAGQGGQYMTALRALRDHVEKSCDNVGERFPEEARKMHYGEAEKRNIYGEASADEAGALADEGIDVQQIPWAPDHDA